uniref:Glycosyltransferase family 92 protein n=1 Tax=Ditylenchus dipsaci TaxID=166011 RepID=A0A915D2T1_9BILA
MFCHLTRRSICLQRSRFPFPCIPTSLLVPSSVTRIAGFVFRLTLFMAGLVVGFSLYHRTTNMWALKNLGDSLLVKSIGRRPIVIGAFHRPSDEQNVAGAYAVMLQFVGDTRQSHELYCISEDRSTDGQKLFSTAHIQRIHRGKRAANDICSWSGHLAECAIASKNVKQISLSTNPKGIEAESIKVELEDPLSFGPQKLPLVVCIAPMYIYTDWQILITGMEIGKVLLRDWPKWPVLSDVNPNGLVLSRGIEESHVNCLHFVKPFAEMVVFTDIDDMLMPLDPRDLHPTVNVEILKSLFNQHPNAGSLLFEHRDVQFALPEEGTTENTLFNFNFDFLKKTQWKTTCKVWRMKTRVVVNASRVDTVNMHETGIHRFGYVQTRVPCRQAHFYHLRHSYKNIALNEWPIDTSKLVGMLTDQWNTRVKTEFNDTVIRKSLVKSSTESFEDFDKCMGSINEEHWSLKVSRCLTPHVCYSKLARNMGCVAMLGEYEFSHSKGDYITVLRQSKLVESEPNCEAPLPKYFNGNHYYMP